MNFAEKTTNAIEKLESILVHHEFYLQQLPRQMIVSVICDNCNFCK
jgi:hypothetical protein